MSLQSDPKRFMVPRHERWELTGRVQFYRENANLPNFTGQRASEGLKRDITGTISKSFG